MSYIKKIGRVAYNAYVKGMETAFSKKFMVFMTATGLLVINKLTAELWLPIALAMLGVETALDLKNGNKKRHFDDE